MVVMVMMVSALSTLGAFSTLSADTADGADVTDGTSRDLGCADPACATVHAYLLGFTLTCWSRELLVPQILTASATLALVKQQRS